MNYKSGQILKEYKCMWAFVQVIFHSQFGTLRKQHKLLVLLNNILKFLEKQSAVSEAGTTTEVIVLLEYFYYLVSKIKESLAA